MSLVYIYCKRNPNQRFQFLFIIMVKAKYFPLAYILLQYVLGANILDLFVGRFVGHIYIYFKELLPLSTGKTYMYTPYFM